MQNSNSLTQEFLHFRKNAYQNTSNKGTKQCTGSYNIH